MFPKIKLRSIFSTLFLLITISAFSQTSLCEPNTYYVSNNGSDENNGTCSDKAWRTIEKVNNFSFPQDAIVKFKRGDEWREQIIGKSNITYKTYGTGNKPLFNGALRGDDKRWDNLGGNKWSTPLVEADGIELISNYHFNNNHDDWALTKDTSVANANITTVNSEAKISCISNNGTNKNAIQFFFTGGLNIQPNTRYKLTFKARTHQTTLNHTVIQLMTSQEPWMKYSLDESDDLAITNTMQTFVCYFDTKSDALSSDARITFFLGNNTGTWELFLDDISFEKMMIPTQEGELFSNGTFDSDTSDWYFFKTVDASLSHDSTTQSAIVTCTDNDAGDSGAIQFFKKDFKIQDDFKYRLTFKAKATAPINDLKVKLMAPNSPYVTYSNIETLTLDDNDWNHYVLYFDTDVPGANDIHELNNARLTFYFGATGEPWTLYIDDISLQKTVDDVGNIIFTDTAGATDDFDTQYDFGIKQPSNPLVVSDKGFYSDRNNATVYLNSDTDPNTLGFIELALNRDIIYQKDQTHTTIEDLECKFGGSSGYRGFDVSSIQIRNNTFSYCGGGYQPGHSDLRYGNGITFLRGAEDIIVERNRVHQMYDGGVTNHNNALNRKQNNIVYRNNFISNTEIQFMYFSKGISTDNIYYINNTSVFAGYTWAHHQRPDERPVHMRIGEDYTNKDINEFKVFIYNNIFYESYFGDVVDDNGCYLWFQDQYSLRNVKLKNNLIYDSNSEPANQRMILVAGPTGIHPNNWFHFDPYTVYGDYDHFITIHIDGYLVQEDACYDLNTKFGDPLFNDINNNPTFPSTSICKDNGNDFPANTTDYLNNPIYGSLDYEGNPRQDGVLDIGCFEIQSSSNRLANNTKEDTNSLILLYPNPAENNLIIKNLDKSTTYSILDINGRILNQGTAKNDKTIDINKLPSGLYFLKLNNSVTKKFIKL
nr:T9SS type A sorting domain-containing protein [uncultured Psychroserpens sp.]